MIKLFKISAIILFLPIQLIAQKGMTAEDVIASIKQNVTCEWATETVDTFKAGDPTQEVTGITTTFIATMDVLKESVKEGNNLIITHEPTFYNHLDKTDHLKNDPVYLAKLKYIEDYGLIIFRFHDHIHRTSPDGIIKGMIDRLGWEESRVEGEELIFDFPEMYAGDLAKDFVLEFDKSPIRLIGNPKAGISKVAFVPGAPGYMAHVKMLQREDVDLVVGGEVPEWESITYVRDATGAGMNKTMILIGHVNSEEDGMDYCAKWMSGFIKDIPIKFIPAGDPFYTPR